jgi:hypothetical protein
MEGTFYSKQTMKAQTGTMARGDYGKRITKIYSFKPGATQWWAVNATLRPPYPGNETRYPVYRRLGEPQGRCGGELRIWSPPGFDSEPSSPDNNPNHTLK